MHLPCNGHDVALGIHELIYCKANYVFPSHAGFGNASNQINICHLFLLLEVIYSLYFDNDKGITQSLEEEEEENDDDDDDKEEEEEEEELRSRVLLFRVLITIHHKKRPKK